MVYTTFKRINGKLMPLDKDGLPPLYLPGQEPNQGIDKKIFPSATVTVQQEGDKSGKPNDLLEDNTTKNKKQRIKKGSINYDHPTITDAHWEELTVESAIDPETARLNFISLDFNTPGEYPDSFSYLNVYGENNKNVLANGTLDAYTLRKHQNLFAGGWWVSGVELHYNKGVFLAKKMEDWGQFKANVARQIFDKTKNRTKPVKYESPSGVLARILFLTPGGEAWKKVFHNFKVHVKGLKNPYNPHTEGQKFWIWVAQNKIPVIICEGAKKAAALLSQGYAAIGLPGISMGYRKDTETWIRTLHPDISALLINKRDWYFCFDAETKPTTRQNVNAAISRMGGLLMQAGQKVRVICLPTPKNLGDKMGVDDFIASGGDFHGLFQNAPTLIEWRAAWTRVLTLNENKHWIVKREEMQEVNGKRYLPSDLLKRIPESELLVGIKAPMGSGKTEIVAPLVAPDKVTINPSSGSNMVSPWTGMVIT
ncbi:MAG: DUF3854 domain-containing protein [Nostoc sp.]|uniref:DUF3854 domain-containing protein n=1 Tax=Nostoc sp. TaxID=1180 RepID=UPI002FF1A07C